jgi:hypothetical protein
MGAAAALASIATAAIAPTSETIPSLPSSYGGLITTRRLQQQHQQLQQQQQQQLSQPTPTSQLLHVDPSSYRLPTPANPIPYPQPSGRGPSANGMTNNGIASGSNGMSGPGAATGVTAVMARSFGATHAWAVAPLGGGAVGGAAAPVAMPLPTVSSSSLSASPAIASPGIVSLASAIVSLATPVRALDGQVSIGADADAGMAANTVPTTVADAQQPVVKTTDAVPV